MLLVVVPVAFLAPVVSEAVSVADPAVHYFWQWSDGSRARSRTFTDPGIGPVDLPGLVVASQPPMPGRRVVLRFRDDGRWQVEDVARTDEHGVAIVRLNPYCANGAWCDRSWAYRLQVADQTAAIDVTYVD